MRTVSTLILVFVASCFLMMPVSAIRHCPEDVEMECHDGIDNDEDGAIDCEDTDCRGESEDVCDDSVDNDCDGSVDCGDSDCAGVIAEKCRDGLDNDCDGAADCEDAEDCVLDGRNILITEVQPHPVNTLDVNGEYLELVNNSEKCADISGYSIRDASGVPATVIPNGTIIGPFFFMLIAGSLDWNLSCVQAWFEFEFDGTFNDDGDTILLMNPQGEVQDELTYTGDECPPGASLEDCGNGFHCGVVDYGCGDLGSPGQPNTCFNPD